jgi:hypothetical protein
MGEGRGGRGGGGAGEWGGDACRGRPTCGSRLRRRCGPPRRTPRAPPPTPRTAPPTSTASAASRTCGPRRARRARGGEGGRRRGARAVAGRRRRRGPNALGLLPRRMKWWGEVHSTDGCQSAAALNQKSLREVGCCWNRAGDPRACHLCTHPFRSDARRSQIETWLCSAMTARPSSVTVSDVGLCVQ